MKIIQTKANRNFQKAVLYLISILIILSILLFLLPIEANDACPGVDKINLSKDNWTARDDAELEIARIRCKPVTGLPCLITFTKVESGIYRAICGEKRDHENKPY